MGITLQGPTTPNTQPWEKDFNSEPPFGCPPDCPHLENCDGTAEGHNQFYAEEKSPDHPSLEIIDEEELRRLDQIKELESKQEEQRSSPMNPETQNQIDELDKLGIELPEVPADFRAEQTEPNEKDEVDKPKHEKVPEPELTEEQLQQRAQEAEAAILAAQDKYIQKELKIEGSKSNTWELVLRDGLHDALLPDGTYLLDTVDDVQAAQSGNLTKEEWSAKLVEIYENGYAEVPVLVDGEIIGMSIYTIENGAITPSYYEVKPQEIDEQFERTGLEQTTDLNPTDQPEDLSSDDQQEPEVTTIPLTPFQQINLISFAENGISLEVSKEEPVIPIPVSEARQSETKPIVKGVSPEFFAKVGITVVEKEDVKIEQTAIIHTAENTPDVPVEAAIQTAEANNVKPVTEKQVDQKLTEEKKTEERSELEDLDTLTVSPVAQPTETRISSEVTETAEVAAIHSTPAAPKANENINKGAAPIAQEAAPAKNIEQPEPTAPDQGIFVSESVETTYTAEADPEAVPEAPEYSPVAEVIVETPAIEVKEQTNVESQEIIADDQLDIEETVTKAERLVDNAEESASSPELWQAKEELKVQVEKAREVIKALEQLKSVNSKAGSVKRNERNEGIFSLLGLIKGGSRKNDVTDDTTRTSPLQPKAAKNVSIRKAA